MNSVPGVMQLDSKGVLLGAGSPLASNSLRASALSRAARNLVDISVNIQPTGENGEYLRCLC